MSEANRFAGEAAVPGHPLYQAYTARVTPLYERGGEVRSPFARDYTRILHCMGYRRLKHKTQVFYNIEKDHICTRMEHVSHVESVSSTIARYLGLNDELTRAISIGHDVGHAPFGHEGERILSEFSEEYLGRKFWHEQNGLRFVDDIELLANDNNEKKNLNLTYAVRDGIISHCGEVDENGLRPRQEMIDLADFSAPGQYAPATWEGCVVKISDKIAYIGRDIEDAISLGFIDEEARHELMELAKMSHAQVLNTTVLISRFITDICAHSSPEAGICLSEEAVAQMKAVKEFNYRHIYRHKRFEPFTKYARLVIRQLFSVLLDTYDGPGSFAVLSREARYCPELMTSFAQFLAKYADPAVLPAGTLADIGAGCVNRKVYGRLETKEIYVQAIIDYISGMTDRYAVAAFEELLKY